MEFSIVGLSEFLSKRIKSFDKFVDLPIKIGKIFDLNHRIEYNFQIRSAFMLQLLRKVRALIASRLLRDDSGFILSTLGETRV